MADDDAADDAYRRPQQVTDADLAGPDASSTIPVSPVSSRVTEHLPAYLTDAFSRPDAETPGLTRPSDDTAAPEAETPEPPWRRPDAPISVGVPALAADEEPEHVVAAPRFTVRQLLTGRLVHPGALAILLTVMLAVGAGGAVLGAVLSRAGHEPAATVTFADSTGQGTGSQTADHPAGSVSSVAAAVVPAVVSIEVAIGTTGDTGSGVLFASAGKTSYVLTNNHVVAAMASNPTAVLTVVFNDTSATRVPAKVRGTDPRTDLAVLEIVVANPVLARLGDSDQLAVGDPVIAVGSPLGLQGTVTTGIVSAVHRPVRLTGNGIDTGAVIDAIQTDAAVNPGNSGGPLVDATGAVVGINTAIRTLGNAQVSGSIGLGFAVPMNTARAVATKIIANSPGAPVIHPTMKVTVSSVTDGTTNGAQVVEVDPAGPAQQAGIRAKDVITEIGDRRVGGADEFAVAIAAHEVGDAVTVHISRDGKELGPLQVQLVADQ